MSSLVLTGDTSGSGTITVPAVAGTFTATIGSATGTHFPFTSGTAVASTSGTSIDFTSIPSWVKRITVMFSGVSTNGTSAFLIQLGTSGSPDSSGYVGSGSNIGTGSTGVSGSTAGFILMSGAIAANTYQGSVVLTLTDSSTNMWTSNGNLSRSSNDSICSSAGTKTSTAGSVDVLRITTAGGTNTFDAGTINILYE